ncbi:MAG: asparaginase [Alphaproteobacteria bacterium]|nr:asparaginase [Alphaproteobacteria bacterium]
MDDLHDHRRNAPAPDETGNPVLVEVVRGPMVESRHRGAIAVVVPDGTVVHAVGDVTRDIYPRSAIKPVQALPLVETGAADAFGFGNVELSMACASHLGEARHVAAALSMLEAAGASPEDYECGAQPPAHPEAARDLAAAGEAPHALHNNCSGKHAGMIATARHKGEQVQGYTDITHPVQQRILGVFESMTGCDLGHAARGIDGCSVPVWAMPLGNLALAMARMADPSDQPETRQAAVRRIRDALATEPFYMHGSGAFGTDVIAAAGPDVLVKGGAEGVYTAILPALGLGVALKIDDGAGRAAELAMIHTLDRLGALSDQAREKLTDRLSPVQTNWAGREVGVLRPADGLAF